MSAQAVGKSVEVYRQSWPDVPQASATQHPATLGKFLLQADQRVQRIGRIVEQAFIVFIHGTGSGDATRSQNERLIKKAESNIPDFKDEIVEEDAAKLSYPAYLFHLHLHAYRQSDIALSDVKRQISDLIGEISKGKAEAVRALEPERYQYLVKQSNVSSDIWLSRVEQFKTLMASHSRQVDFKLLSKKAVLGLLITGECRNYLEKNYVETVFEKGGECFGWFLLQSSITTLINDWFTGCANEDVSHQKALSEFIDVLRNVDNKKLLNRLRELDFPIDECVITTEPQSTEELKSPVTNQSTGLVSPTLSSPPPTYDESQKVPPRPRTRERCVLS